MSATDRGKALAKIAAAASFGACSLFASFPMDCPLCNVRIPANTRHECETPAPQPPQRKRRDNKRAL